MRTSLLTLAAALGLAACGPLNQGNVARGVLGIVQDRFTGGGAAAAPAAPVLTREQADANPGAYLLVTAYGGASVAAMVQAAGIGNRMTWISSDNVTVTLEDGIVVATRGFPRDLIAVELRGVREAIAAGGGTAQRVHETINDTDQIQTELLQCSIAFEASESITILSKTTPVRRFSEACTGQSVRFTNVYWVSGDGGILRSNQAVAPATGFLTLERP